jgi:hypothetical protein
LSRILWMSYYKKANRWDTLVSQMLPTDPENDSPRIRESLTDHQDPDLALVSRIHPASNILMQPASGAMDQWPSPLPLQ